MRKTVKKIVSNIEPFDELEANHKNDTLAWIDSGEELFRLEKPATPPKHLVSYFVVVDKDKRKLMLVDHIKAELWLPSGGHVEKDEDPKETVRREIVEELNFDADFMFDDPILVTETTTVGKTAGHIDISLWYVVKADSEKEIIYDPSEFNGYKWFNFKEVLETPISELDPHMHRFTKKLLMLA